MGNTVLNLEKKHVLKTRAWLNHNRIIVYSEALMGFRFHNRGFPDHIYLNVYLQRGRDSSVGIATVYGLDD
jgi:hypothetical protein